MAILKVSILGNPVLRKIARPIAMKDIRSSKLQALIDSMIETMTEYNGVGIAAPQVNVSKQIVVFRVRNNPRYPDAPRIPLTVLINPRITPLSAEMESDFEGCLSVPNLRGAVPRFVRIKVGALNRKGKNVSFIAKGFHARVIQHENDHLKGKVFIDRMTDLTTLTYLAVSIASENIPVRKSLAGRRLPPSLRR